MWVKEFIDSGCPSMSLQSIQERREGYIASTVLAGESKELHHVKTIQLKHFSLKLFKPSNEENLPVVIYFHGGCFVSGSFQTHDQQLREIAYQSHALVVAVEYRLALEYAYPTAHNDAYDAANYIFDNCESWGGEKDNIILAGDSAGGHIALITTLRLRDYGQWLPKKQILVYPMLDATASCNSYGVNGESFVITKDTLVSGFEMYLNGSGVSKVHPEISPLFRDDLHGLPETHILTAEYDPLLDEGELFHKKLLKSGVQSHCVRYLGVIHGFIQLSGISQAARDSISHISRIIKSDDNTNSNVSSTH